jgi:hypothetical protein
MPFRVTITRADIQTALDAQGLTAARASNLDRLDVPVSSRAAPGAAMTLTPAERDAVGTAIWSRPDTEGGTGSFGARIRANLDAAVSSRAAPGAAMDLVPAARAAIWNELIPATPASGSYGERVKANLDAAVSSRATPAQVAAELANAGVTAARMARLDFMATVVSNSGSVAAASNTAGLAVSLDTAAAGMARTVIEVRYSAGGPATFVAEGSDDGTTWFVGDQFSEAAAVTDRLTGYLNTHRFFRFRSPTTGIDLSFMVRAVL